MLADRLKTLAPSPTLAMQAKAKAMRAQGIDVISFGAGEPDFDTPRRIKDAAIRAIEQGQTKYTEVGGVPELRAAVCQKFKRDNGLDYAPDEVTVSCGAKHTLYNLFMALVNPGDEVLIPSPYWVSYPEQVRLLGGVPVPVVTPESTGFDLDPAELRRAVTPRTKMIVLDSPGNPTGAVFSPAALAEVAKLAVERDLWIVSDECYEALTYEGRHVSIASLSAEVKARTIVVNTCSKAYAMTGWRIGYAAGPKAVIKAMTDVQSQVTSNPASVSQWAAVEALGGPQDEVAKMTSEFDRRRRVDHRRAQRCARRALRDAQGRVLRVPERLRPLRQARPGRRPSGARRTCARSSSTRRASPPWRASTSGPTRIFASRTRRASR